MPPDNRQLWSALYHIGAYDIHSKLVFWIHQLETGQVNALKSTYLTYYSDDPFPAWLHTIMAESPEAFMGDDILVAAVDHYRADPYAEISSGQADAYAALVQCHNNRRDNWKSHLDRYTQTKGTVTR